MARENFKDAVEGSDEFVLFCYNLDVQTTPEFRQTLSKLNGKVKYGVKNLTDCWQMEDAGYSKLLKVLGKTRKTTLFGAR